MKHNPAAWFEIFVDDMARATKFYEFVLGTKQPAAKFKCKKRDRAIRIYFARCGYRRECVRIVLNELDYIEQMSFTNLGTGHSHIFTCIGTE